MVADDGSGRDWLGAELKVRTDVFARWWVKRHNDNVRFARASAFSLYILYVFCIYFAELGKGRS